MIIVNKIVNFFTNPIREFKGYKEKKTVGINLLIVLLFSIVQGLIKPTLIPNESALSSFDEEKRRAMIEFYENSSRPEVAVPSAIFAILLAVIVGSFVYYLIAKNLTENKERNLSFIDTLEVYSFSYIALLIGEVVISLTHIGLLTIPFQIWFYILLVLGFENALNVPRKKFIWIAAGFFILTNLGLFFSISTLF